MEMVSYSDIEQFYEKNIIPQYAIKFGDITWNDHGKIGEDTFAHYFTASGKKYILVFEDFPSQSHFIAEDSEFIPVHTSQSGLVKYPGGDGPIQEYVENITGFFGLYLEG